MPKEIKICLAEAMLNFYVAVAPGNSGKRQTEWMLYSYDGRDANIHSHLVLV